MRAGLVKTVSLIALAALAFGTAGTFFGHWLWQAYTNRQAAQAATAAATAAEAERVSPKGRQRAAVRALLHDPDSAVFRNEKEGRDPPRWWCGEVNARNRMGGMVGFTPYIVELSEADPANDRADLAPSRDREESTQLRLFYERANVWCFKPGENQQIAVDTALAGR